MTGRLERAAPRATIGTIALAALMVGATSGVANSSSTAAASTSSPPSKLAPIHGPYDPDIDPANFVARVDDRYLPFIPGTGFHSRASAEQRADRRRGRHSPDQADTRHQVATVVRDTAIPNAARRSSGPSTITRRTSRAESYVHGRASLEKQRGRRRASDSWEGGVNGGNPASSCPATRAAATPTDRSTTRPARLSTKHGWLAIAGASRSPTAPSSGLSSRPSAARWSPTRRRSTTSPGSARSRSRWSRDTTRPSS